MRAPGGRRAHRKAFSCSRQRLVRSKRCAERRAGQRQSGCGRTRVRFVSLRSLMAKRRKIAKRVRTDVARRRGGQRLPSRQVRGRLHVPPCRERGVRAVAGPGSERVGVLEDQSRLVPVEGASNAAEALGGRGGAGRPAEKERKDRPTPVSRRAFIGALASKSHRGRLCVKEGRPTEGVAVERGVSGGAPPGCPSTGLNARAWARPGAWAACACRRKEGGRRLGGEGAGRAGRARAAGGQGALRVWEAERARLQGLRPWQAAVQHAWRV
jgi:hypothetical protein